MKFHSVPLHIASTGAEAAQAHTHFSIPFAHGELKEFAGARILDRDGREFPAQAWPLAWWPDGSVRVIHGLAALGGGDYQVEAITPSAPAPSGLRVEHGTDGELRVVNDSGSVAFPRRALVCGRFEMRVHVRWADGSLGAMALEGGAEVRKQGPLFLQVERWVKVAAEGRHLRFRFQFEFFRGVPGVAVNVLLVHDCPGVLFQEIRSIEVRLGLAHARPVVFQQSHGFEYLESRFVETEEAVDVRVDDSNFHPYVYNHEALRDGNVYPHYLRPPANRTIGAVFLKGDNEVLQMEMEDFHLLRPKGISLDPGEANFALWPEWAEPLRLQQGRRRQVRLALSWGDKEIPRDLASARAASAALLDLHRAQLPAEVYARTKFFDQSRVLACQPGKYPRFEGWLLAMSKIRTVAAFFDLGDTPDGGYQTTYTPLGYSRRKSPGPAPRFYTNSGQSAQCFEHLDEYEPIWVNNEYDVIFAMGTEFLRSGHLHFAKLLRWHARHTVEVDFLCYSDLPAHHRAQPAHSENHTSTGAYPSHFWTQGLTQYYFLSGDEDVLEVICALADKTIWYFEHPVLGGLHSGVNRELGCGILSLVSAYEATGDAKYDRYARKIIDAVVAEPLPKDLPAFSFGETSLMLGCRAYLEVHQHSDAVRPVWEWWLRYLDLAIRCSRNPSKENTEAAYQLSYGAELASRGDLNRNRTRPGVLSGFAAPDCLAYACERTGDTAYLEVGLLALEAFLDENPGYCGDSKFRSPTLEGKPFALAYRTWINYLGALDRVGWLKHFDYQTPDFSR